MARKTSTSMKDVAALARVSLGTVSNVVNSPELVSAPTRERVQDAIAKLGWVPNESARQLRAGRSRSIGMVVMDIANPFFIDVLLGAEELVLQRGYSVQVGNSASQLDRERAQLRLFEQQRVRGVLCAPISGVDDRVQDLRRRGIPVVLLDRTGDQTGYCSASVDDVEGGRLAVQHLLRLGHRRVALVGGSSDIQQVRDRRLGAEVARAQAGGTGSLLTISTAGLDSVSGAAAADELVALRDAERPTAVFAANDLLAIGLLQGFVTHGLRVPEDVALIGYDDIAFAASAAVPLTSVQQPRTDLGRRAAELLFDEIEAAEEDRPHQHQSVQFTPTLAVRRSTVGAGQAWASRTNR